MLIPNQKIDTMELLYPKRKPVGKVKIDWSHPLTQGLRCAFLFTNNVPYDIVNNIKGVVVNGANFKPASGGQGWEFSSAVSSYLEFPDSKVYSFESNTPMTIFSSIHRVTGTTTNLPSKYLDNSPFTGEYSFSINPSSNKMSLQCLQGGSLQRVFALTVDTVPSGDVTVGCTYNGGSIDESIALYTNGRAQAVTYLGQDAVFNTMENTVAPLTIGAVLIDSPYASYTDGTSYLHLMYDKALSDQEIKSLHDDPYQFLIPA